MSKNKLLILIISLMLILLIFSSCSNKQGNVTEEIITYITANVNIENKDYIDVFDKNNMYMFTVGSYSLSDEDIKLVSSILPDDNKLLCNMIIDLFSKYNLLEYDEEDFVDYTDVYSEDSINKILDRVSKEYLYKFLLNNSRFGEEYIGIVSASSGYFNKKVSNLNSYQLNFLKDVMGNPLQDVTEISNKYGIDFNTDGYKIVDLSDFIIDNIMSSYNFDSTFNGRVKLGIDYNQQIYIQNLLDRGLKDYLNFDSYGSRLIDGSILVINKNNGFMQTFIPCRSDSNGLLFINVGKLASNWIYLLNEIKSGYISKISLIPMEQDENGIKYYTALHGFKEDTLANGEDNIFSVLDVLDTIFINTDGYYRPSIVYEAIADNGERYTVSEDLPSLSLDSDIYNFLSIEEGLKCGFLRINDYSVLSFTDTSEYISLIMLGTREDIALSQEQKDDLSSLVELINTEIDKLYEYGNTKLWNDVDFIEFNNSIYDTNFSIISEYVYSGLDILDIYEIYSSDTLYEWEHLFEDVQGYINNYKDYISTDKYDELMSELRSIRESKSKDILKYSID